MGRTSALGAFIFEEEDVWGEPALSFSKRAAVLDTIDVSTLNHEKTPAARTVQYLQDYTHPIRGVMGGSFKTRFWLPGHGVATTTAPTINTLETLLGYVLGNVTSSGPGSTVANGPPSAPASFNTVINDGLVPGGIVFVGSLSDGAALGQAGAIKTHVAKDLELHTALPATPNVGDVVASSVVVYPYENAAQSFVQPIRAELLTVNHSFVCHGCYPMSLTIDGLSPGEIPQCTVEWGVSWWERRLADEFPTTLEVDIHNPAPIAAGSFCIQTRGTTTRDLYAIREFKITVNLNTIIKRGPGGLNEFQAITGATRGPMDVDISFVVDSPEAGNAATWAERWDSDSQDYHFLYTWSGAASGRRGAIYCPNSCIVGVKPLQFDFNGYNAERVMMRPKTGVGTTNALELSAFRIALG